ncbi:MAG TPA: response regulator [Acidimicrobiales bacterium]|nr:response regulator [Acidimicrobiales bacterium]
MMVTSSASRSFSPDMGRPVRILLVEDSPSDVAMTIEALREGRIANEMHVVDDGEVAMDFLHREGEFADAPRPDLIILDLNLPRKDGREVLEEIKNDEDLKAIPVVVLTTSSAEADILRSYKLHANSYVTKPVGFEPFLAAVHAIEEFWLALVRLPPGR